MDNLRQTIRGFLLENFFPSEPPDALSNDADLFECGVLDSLGVLKLVAFIEDKFNLEFLPEELASERLSTVENIESLVRGKMGAEA